MTRIAALLLLALVPLAACDDAMQPDPVASVTVSPQGQTLAPSATLQLTATVKDASDTQLTDRVVTWETTNSSIAAVDAAGLVTAVASGTATITAHSEGQSGSTTLTVAAGVASITLAPDSANLAVGGTRRLTATLRDLGGNPLAGRPLAWASSSNAVATVDSTGLVTGVAPGRVTITATREGRVGTAVIRVLGPIATVAVSPDSAEVITGFTRQLTATLRDANGSPLTGAVAWSSSNPAVATVDGNGLVTATGDGVATITATSGGHSGSATVGATGLAQGTISAVTTHACALTRAGAAYCWGLNNFGQLGDGTTNDSPTPIPVAGGLTFSAISAGFQHTCAIATSGAAYCWGDGSQGQVGNGASTLHNTSPVPVAGGLTFRSIAAGMAHTVAVSTAGAAFGWGRNVEGELGDGTVVGSNVPVPALGGFSFQDISAGNGHTVAITAAGAAYAWGRNDLGQLGDGTQANRSTPVAVLGGLAFKSISAGEFHTAAVTTAGAAYGWGSNTQGEVGDGATSITRLTPTATAGGLVFALIRAAGDINAAHTCALTPAGAAYCWGNNEHGQLGNGTPPSRDSHSATPVAVLGGHAYRDLGAGGYRSCALTTFGRAYCWGITPTPVAGAPTFLRAGIRASRRR